MGIMGSETAYDILDPNAIDRFYKLHLRPVKIRNSGANGINLSNGELKELNDALNQALKNTFVNLGAEQKPVSLYDFYTFIESMYLVWSKAIDIGVVNIEKFREKLPAYKNDYEDLRLNNRLIVDQKIAIISWIASTIYQVVWVNSDTELDRNPILGQAIYINEYQIIIEKSETLLLEIDGNKRSIYRIGLNLPGNGISWLSITPAELGMNGVLPHFPLKIYVQSHVVERLNERLDPFLKGFGYFIIITCLIEKKIFRCDDGSFLYLFDYNSKKLGYLKADIIGDKLLVRTFLFLTNNGTPEGKKLEELFGIQKADKKYMGIDRLSTFVNSDIEDNEELKQLFCKAGCGSLFEMKKVINTLPDKTLHIADFLSNYLGLERDETLY